MSFQGTPQLRKQLVRWILAEQKKPSKWDDFLAAKYDGGKRKVPNPNLGTREKYPEVALSTAFKYEKNGMHPIWDDVYREYLAWLGKDAPKSIDEISELIEKVDPTDSKSLKNLDREIKKSAYPDYYDHVTPVIKETLRLKKLIKESQSPKSKRPVLKFRGFSDEEIPEQKKKVRDIINKFPPWMQGLFGDVPVTIVESATWDKVLKEKDIDIPTVKGFYDPHIHEVQLSDGEHLEIVLNHELGHVFDRCLAIPVEQGVPHYFAKLWKKAVLEESGRFPDEDMKKFISYYASSHPCEDFAECFAYNQKNPEALRNICKAKAKAIKNLTDSPESLLKALWKIYLYSRILK